MTTIKLLGLLLLAYSLPDVQAVDPDADRYLNVEQFSSNNNLGGTPRVFNFDQYAAATPDQRAANGVDAASQSTLNFITQIYQDVRAAGGTRDAALAQLEVTATSIIQPSGRVTSIYLTSQGQTALEGLQTTLGKIAQQDPQNADASLVTLANKQLVQINDDANKLDGDNNELAMVLPGLVNAGAETAESIQVCASARESNYVYFYACL